MDINWTETIALIHLASTWFMVGLIWFVQVVHYPGFANIAKDSFVNYTKAHVQQTGWVVGPPMLVEAASALALALLLPSALTWTALGLLAFIWLSTALLQVPAHRRLNEEFDPTTIGRLVRTNWLRTVAWSARGVLAVVFVY